MIVSLFDWEHKKLFKYSCYYIDSYDYSRYLPKVKMILYYSKQSAGNATKGLSLFNIYDSNRVRIKAFSISSFHAVSRYNFENSIVNVAEFLYGYLIILHAIFLHKEMESIRLIHQGLFIENRRDVFSVLRGNSLFKVFSYAYSTRVIAHQNLHAIIKYL